MFNTLHMFPASIRLFLHTRDFDFVNHEDFIKILSIDEFLVYLFRSNFLMCKMIDPFWCLCNKITESERALLYQDILRSDLGN